MGFILMSDHDIPDRAPLLLAPGDVIQVGEHDTEWPAFVFVTSPRGTGWVPSRHLDIEGADGVVRVGYDTTELAGGAGELVDVLREDPASGWSWCRNAHGEEGWIPDRVLTAE